MNKQEFSLSVMTVLVLGVIAGTFSTHLINDVYAISEEDNKYYDRYNDGYDSSYSYNDQKYMNEDKEYNENRYNDDFYNYKELPFNVPIDIPLIKGYVDGTEIYYIATDSSDLETAEKITELTGFKVNYAPILSKTPKEVAGQIFVFKNGIKGDGPFYSQISVLSGKPGDKNYSPLYHVNLVEWKDEHYAQELRSVDQILAAQEYGDLKIYETGIVVNKPAVKWDGGQLMIREETKINDHTPYGGGQVLNIDIENMVATFIAHGGWGPNGEFIYYIVTDAVPKKPAEKMGVVYAKSDEELAKTSVAIDLYQFKNGINGTGPMGYQAGIGSASTDSPYYSPMWRINFVEWKTPQHAKLLLTMDDIYGALKYDIINVSPAMEGKHIVNCPFFEPKTVLEHAVKY
ncbi:MAG: DUF7482 domain-containing protein [Nitrososphaeraceae archaeon]